MKATKTTKAKPAPRATSAKVKSEPMPTIGEYIDRRLYSMACNGLFGDPCSIDPRAALPGIIDEYVNRYRFVRF